MPTTLRIAIERLFSARVAELTACPDLEALLGGAAPAGDYDRFVEAVVRTHARSPQLLAFLYALAPPRVLDDLRHNLLEELGLDEPSGIAHPALLRELALAAGLGPRLPALEAEASEELRRLVVEPLLYGTLRDVGLAALGEVVAFEYMLARLAGSMARALATHRRLGPTALAWFTHHSEVDLRHAEQGLAALEAYVDYYAVPEEEALTILDLALRPNPFIRRYFAVRRQPGARRGAVTECRA
jgi:hypothetical protein